MNGFGKSFWKKVLRPKDICDIIHMLQSASIAGSRRSSAGDALITTAAPLLR